MIKHISHIKKITSLGLIALIGISSYIVLERQRTDSAETSYSSFLQNFQANSKLTVSYKASNQKEASIITKSLDNRGAIELEENNLITENLNGYAVSFDIQNQRNQHTSFDLKINSNNIASTLKGLPLKSSVFVTLDKKIIEKKVPSDWTGAINFNHAYEMTNKSQRLCFIINHRQPSTLCHVIPAMKGALS